MKHFCSKSSTSKLRLVPMVRSESAVPNIKVLTFMLILEDVDRGMAAWLLAACLQKRVGQENCSIYTILSRSDVVHESVPTHSPPTRYSIGDAVYSFPTDSVCQSPFWANKAVNSVNCLTSGVELV